MNKPMGMSAGRALMKTTGCTRSKRRRDYTTDLSGTAIKREIDAGYRRFWARRGRDVASFAFDGGMY
jgi:hypothetical protein